MTGEILVFFFFFFFFFLFFFFFYFFSSSYYLSLFSENTYIQPSGDFEPDVPGAEGGQAIKVTLTGEVLMRITKPDIPLYRDGGKFMPTSIAVFEVKRRKKEKEKKEAFVPGHAIRC